MLAAQAASANARRSQRLPLRVRLRSRRPADSSVPGHIPHHDARWCSSGKIVMSTPISAMTFSIVVRLTPGIRSNDSKTEAAVDALEIFDVTGRRVSTLHEGPLGSGLHTWEWQARDGRGARVVAGVYFARLRIGRESTAIKVVVL